MSTIVSEVLKGPNEAIAVGGAKGQIPYRMPWTGWIRADLKDKGLPPEDFKILSNVELEKCLCTTSWKRVTCCKIYLTTIPNVMAT